MAKPDLVLTGTVTQEGKGGDILEQTIVAAAKKLGILTVAVQDFWDGMGNYYKRFTDERNGQKLALLPDWVAIPDQVAQSEMLAEGFPPGKLVVTGNPNFDLLPAKAAAFTESERRNVRQSLGLLGNTYYFFGGNAFYRSPLNPDYWDLDIVKAIASVLPKLPDVGVAVALHPRMPADQKAEIGAFITDCSQNIKLVSGISSQTLCLAVDLTIVAFSTLGLEAVYMRRPVISLQPGLKGQDQLIVSSKSLIPAAYTQEDCEQLLLKMVLPSLRQQAVDQSAPFTTDGNATRRVTELVYSLLKQ